MHSPGALRSSLAAIGLVASLLHLSPCAANVMIPSCKADAKKCEFTWSVSHWSTMTYNPQNPNEYQRDHCHPVVFLRNGTALARQLSLTVCNDTKPLNKRGKNIFLLVAVMSVAVIERLDLNTRGGNLPKRVGDGRLKHLPQAPQL